jgi:DNA gyrase subunit A
VDEISGLGRNTQGVRLIRLAEGERLVGIERIETLEAGDGAVSGADVPGGEPGGASVTNGDVANGDVTGGEVAGGDEGSGDEPGPHEPV